MFCHNLSGYDGHFFIRALAAKSGWATCIPASSEKYISISKKIPVYTYIDKDGKMKDKMMEIRFLDSFRFINHSLANLVSYLPQESFEILKTFFPKEKHWKLLLKKGAYPYHFDSLDKLKETKLPPIEASFSSLNGEEAISEEEYQHEVTKWDDFEMKTFRDYHDTYVTSDTCQLADAVQNFTKICMEVHKLDPAQYYTAPGLFFDA